MSNILFFMVSKSVIIFFLFCFSRDRDFYISKEMLIATLRHALILSSETPELFKKVNNWFAVVIACLWLT